MEWWWRWGATLGLALALSVPATATPPGAELQAVRMRPSDSGQTLLLHLSAPVDARVSAVRGRNGRLARLYVDLPVGTRAAPGARRLSPAPPVAGARVGQGEQGAPRVVVELADATGYRVRREQDGRVLAVTLTRPPDPPRRAAAVVPPPPAPPAEAEAAVAVEPVPAPAPVVAAAPPVAPLVRRKIVIDPGHGGDDPGAMGFAIEKDVTLAIALRLATLLRERLGADVVLTRDVDATLPLSARTARANTENADMFVSVHANANETGRLRGIETYYLDNTDDHATLRLASMENGLGELRPAAGETDLRYILSDLVQGGKMEESAALASAVQRGVVGRLRRQHSDVVDLGVKRGPFYVLVGAHMPCVLVETSFLSHPVEGRRLARQDYQFEVAEGIFQGIDRFFADAGRAATL